MALDYAADEDLPPEDEAMEEQQRLPPVVVLEQLLQTQNIAATDFLSDDELATMAATVVREYKIDDDSRKEWIERNDDAMELAMLVAKQKDYPFTKASNVKYPLIAVASLQFNARSYPAIVPSDDVVKCKVHGRDPAGIKAARAARVSEYSSYQLLAEQHEWEEDTDRLLVILPIVGCTFRKVYFDPALGRKSTRLVTADRLVVNYHARSLDDVPRITEKIYLYPYEIRERITDGRFIEFDYAALQPGGEDKDDEKSSDQDQDEDALHCFLEQHRLLDLDGDGYPEPYVVTVHESSQKICRIVANFTPETVNAREDGEIISIRREAYFVKYDFLPNPDGGFYGIGFGWLLKDTSEAINTTINEMLDAGHLANVQGGFISASAGIKEKVIRLQKGEWKVFNNSVPMNQAIMPISYPGPSAVLFELLGLMIESGKEMAAIKDVLTGESKFNQTATTTLALIEQGMTVFTAIYKRIYRALKKEFAIHARLNERYLSPEKYNAFFDGEQPFDPAQDFSSADMDILPIADPSAVTRMQKLGKAQLIYETSQNNPYVDPIKATLRLFEAAGIEDAEEVMAPPPEPDPEEELLKRLMAGLAMEDKEADIIEKWSKALKNIAQAEGEEVGQQITAYGAYIDKLVRVIEARSQRMVNGQGRVRGLEGQPGNPMGAQGPAQPGGGNPGAPQGIPAGVNGAAPAGMGSVAGPGGL